MWKMIRPLWWGWSDSQPVETIIGAGEGGAVKSAASAARRWAGTMDSSTEGDDAEPLEKLASRAPQARLLQGADGRVHRSVARARGAGGDSGDGTALRQSDRPSRSSSSRRRPRLSLSRV